VASVILVNLSGPICSIERTFLSKDSNVNIILTIIFSSLKNKNKNQWESQKQKGKEAISNKKTKRHNYKKNDGKIERL